MILAIFPGGTIFKEGHSWKKPRGENEGGAIVTEEVSTLSFFQEFTLGRDPKRIKKG